MPELTDPQVRKAKPTAKPVKLYDERGLYLEVRPSGSKWWRLKYRFEGKEKLLSLGTYPDTGLKEARENRDKERKLLAAGIDPSAARQEAQATKKAAHANSFEAVAREWHTTIHKHKNSEQHADHTLRRFETDIFPYIGAERIDKITPPMLLKTIQRIEARGAIETAHRVLSSCGQVFRYAIPSGRTQGDPSRDLRDALRPKIVRHMSSITEPKRVGELLRSIHGYQGQMITRAALQLASLVFVRPGELRKAEWSEVDLQEATWTIPSDKMKRSKQQKLSGAPHVVPLSTQAVAILRELRPVTEHSRYVFPSLRTRERPMSDNTINAALRRMGYPKEEMTDHGFRAMARTILAERLGIDEPVIEAQLAHVVKDALGRASNRTEFAAQRRQMLQTWADYLDKIRSVKAPGGASAT